VDGNTTYAIEGAGAGAVDISLSPRVLYLEGRTSVAVGDTVAARGVSGAWRMLPGWMAAFTARSPSVPFYIATENLPGNAAPGQNWRQRSPAQPWQAVATETEGSLVVAAPRAGGPLHVSNDGGATWSTDGAPVGDWSAVHAMRLRRIACCTENGAAFRAAAARGGSLYRGGEFGGWVVAPGTEPGAVPGPQAWEAVVALPYGGLTAAVLGGPIYSNGGGGSSSTWTAATASGAGTPLLRRWRALAVALYNPLVAVNEEGEVWLSTDGARTLTPIPVRVDGVAVTTPWHRVAISEDGRTIVVAGATASAVYLSRDAGQSWARVAAPVGDYTALALSRDGQVITAASAAGVLMSRDGGASFSALPVPAGGGWTGTALAGDGNLIVVANAGGALLTSLGNRTSYASGGGAITGGPGQSVEVEFALDAAGLQHYRVRSSVGGPFRID